MRNRDSGAPAANPLGAAALCSAWLPTCCCPCASPAHPSHCVMQRAVHMSFPASPYAPTLCCCRFASPLPPVRTSHSHRLVVISTSWSLPQGSLLHYRVVSRNTRQPFPLWRPCPSHWCMLVSALLFSPLPSEFSALPCRAVAPTTSLAGRWARKWASALACASSWGTQWQAHCE